MRAAERLRSAERRMLDDPFAQLFLGRAFAAALAAARAAGWAPDDPVGMTGYVVARHRFIDDCLRRALAASPATEQVVLLGAGYDTRAFRFGAAATRSATFFELDHPTTSRRKSRIVARAGVGVPAANRRVVEIDFATQRFGEPLRAAGYAAQRRSFFIWEGVSMYLPEPAVRATLAQLRALACGGAEATVELWHGRASPRPLVALANRAGTCGLRLLFGEPVLFGLPVSGAPRFFEGLGFELVELADGAVLRRRYAAAGRRIWPGNYLVHLRW